MIPKTIHYCWFGPNSLGKLQKKCIKSWRKHLPDYELKLWNEENSPMEHPFVKAAYKAEKYAFVADYVRFSVLYKEGGIYLDTDMLVLKSFDEILLKNQVFVGKEDQLNINGAIIGTQPAQPFLKACVESYNIDFDIERLSELAIPQLMSRLSPKFPALKVFPPKVFYAFPFEESIENPMAYKKFITKESYAVHLWDASWVDGIAEYRKGNSLINKIIQKILFYKQ